MPIHTCTILLVPVHQEALSLVEEHSSVVSDSLRALLADRYTLFMMEAGKLRQAASLARKLFREDAALWGLPIEVRAERGG